MVLHESDASPTSSRPVSYRLDDRYVLDQGTVFLSGSQALARLPFEQLRIDRAAGVRTAAFVTGYPGSPLAGYDRDATVVARLATTEGLHMVHRPAMNEELAATAVMGSQLSVTLDSCRYDGVVGIWYGKTPGLDRAGDALRHAMFAGTAHLGGAVALVGDDPSAKSSTLPSSSDGALADLGMPVLFPGDVQDAVDLGRHAVALSRASGLWSAIKVMEVVADGTGTVELHPDRVVPMMPVLEIDSAFGRVPYRPTPTGRLLTPYTLDVEREIHEVRLEVALRYGAMNRLNAVTVRGPHDWVGVVASGSTYNETREALRVLGLRTDDDLRNAGIRLLRLRMPVPLDTAVVRDFADGLAEVIVVEDKNPLLERRIIEALYPLAQRPVVCGKRTPDGASLFPPTGSLTADIIGPRLRSRLAQRLSSDRLAPAPVPLVERRLIPLSINRTPYFCSGCPHNASTRAPDGALVGGGIGCHTMVMLMEQGPFGQIVGVTAMGNEGAQWFGMAPFVDDSHLFQNIGDGTLFHSGMLAVRAAVASETNITYKVLYNGAVSMTGGQVPTGQLDVPALAKVFLAEGVRRALITTDDPSRYRGVTLPMGVDVWPRSRIIEAQQALAGVSGTTVLIHDQRCAAELRRDRKRGRVVQPGWKLVIDQRVCEGCGDCGVKSNCLSVQPIDTPFGRKTAIDQASCNLDASCLDGDCPSFMTVRPSRRFTRRSARLGRQAAARRQPVDVSSLPTPIPVVDTDDCTVRLSGIGGSGVVTVSQILGTAAMLDGFHVRGLDQTGLSQKAGPVVSDVRLTRSEPRSSNRASIGSVDVLVAFDVLVASSDGHLAGASAERTVVVASSAAVGTGSMVVHPGTPFPHAAALDRLRSSSRSLSTIDALAATTAALADAAMANVYLLGVAVQHGAVPVTPEHVEEAITLNGVAVDKNIAAFRTGRVDAHAGATSDAPADPEPLDDLIDRLASDLQAYQSDRYADRFREMAAKAAGTGDAAFATAVTVNLHKLMAYKDEYEVARLLLLSSSRAAAEAVGGPGARIQWNLHPPMLRSIGMQRKLRLGRWARPMLHVLRSARRLRGTPFDVFGMTRLRRIERSLAPEYIDAVDRLIANFTPEVAAEATAIATLPDMVRGYEDLKLERVERYRIDLGERLARLG